MDNDPGLWASGVAAALSTLRSSGSTPTSPVKVRVVDRYLNGKRACLLSRKLWVRVPPDPPKSFRRCPVECDNRVWCQATIASTGLSPDRRDLMGDSQAVRRSIVNRETRRFESCSPSFFQGVAQFAQSACLGRTRSQVRILPP